MLRDAEGRSTKGPTNRPTRRGTTALSESIKNNVEAAFQRPLSLPTINHFPPTPWVDSIHGRKNAVLNVLNLIIKCYQIIFSQNKVMLQAAMSVCPSVRLSVGPFVCQSNSRSLISELFGLLGVFVLRIRPCLHYDL